MKSEWSSATIGEICSKVTSGGTPKTTNSAFYDGGTIPWLNTKEVGFCRIRKTDKLITEEGLRGSSAKWIPENSVIVAMYGATAGKVAVNKIPLTTNQACCNLVIDPKKADYNFIYYYLSYNYLKLLDLANGAAQQNLNTIIIKGFPITLPNVREQKTIAHLLSTLDDKIELNRQRNETLEAMAQALFKSWFVDFDPVIDNALTAGNEIPEALQKRAAARQALGEQRKPLPADIQSLFPDRFVFNDEMGWIPEGWNTKSIDELVELIGGGTPKTSIEEYWDGDIPWFSVVDAPSESDVFVIDTEKHVSDLGVKNSSTKVLRPGTTIISARGTVGKCALVSVPMAMNQSCYAVLGSEGYSDEFTYYLVRYQVAGLQQRSHGSVFSTITRDTFSSIKVPAPPQALSSKFSEAMLPLFQKIRVNLFSNRQLTGIRDALLPKLLSGELRIPDAERQVAEAI